MRKCAVILFVGLVLFSELSDAQTEKTGIAPESVSAPENPAVQELDYIEMDIRTSRLEELADWCRRLGLSDAGTWEELAGRLRTNYGIGAPASETKEGRTITIESARSSEYFTLERVNESYARLKGTVVITVKDGDITHRLKANEVLFNQSRNSISATGAVEYIKEGGGTKEIFKGDSIFINLDTWEGIFLGGASERSLSEKTTAYRFAGEVISRSEEDVTVLQNATITSASREEPYWSIAATKLWLLPSSDWAMAHAVLKVGEIPLLYIPFLYLPGDEVVFHPVLGYRSREGSFVQTTTYLLGRPKAAASSENSITKILGSSSDMERKQEGLFLRSTGKRKVNQDEPSLSILFDIYTNLGAYAGLNASFPKGKLLGKTDLSIGLGLTRDIYQMLPNYYTPFKNNDGISTWNKSDLFGYPIPFRYRFKTTGSLQSPLFSFNWAFPLYSDPYVDRDFLNRTESMDWLQMIKEGGSQSQTSTTNQVTTLGSYQWNLNIAFSGPLFEIKPSIATLSVNSLSSSLYFNTRSVSNPVSPIDGLFFYPERFTLYTTSFVIRGSLLNPPTGKLSVSSSNTNQLSGAVTVPSDLQVPDVWSPWAFEIQQNSVSNPFVPVEVSDPLASLQPPALQQTFTVTGAQSLYKMQMDYSFNPAISTELFFRSNPTHWPTKDAVRWDDFASLFTNFRGDANIGLSLADPSGMLSASWKLTDQSALQIYNYMNQEAEEYDTQTERDAALLRSFLGTYNTIIPELSFKIAPFAQDDIWKATSLQYVMRGTLIKTAYVGDAVTGDWRTSMGEWTKEYVSSHQVQLNLAASTGSLSHNSSFSFELPPRDSYLKSNMNLSYGMSRSSLSFSIADPFGVPVFKPLTVSEELKVRDKVSLKQDLSYDPELKAMTSWNTAAVLGPASVNYRAARNQGSGTLEPVAFSLGYSNAFKDSSIWRNRIAYTLDVNSSLNMDLQRYTNSVFTFTLGTTLKISQFLDLSFSTKSQNSVVFRYMQNWPIWKNPDFMPGEQNALVDLLNSFRFDNEELRKKSGFKLKSLNFKAVHYLGDWNATLGIDLTPYLNTTIVPKRYQFNTSVSFLVQWIPIPEFKTETFSDTKNGFIFK